MVKLWSPQSQDPNVDDDNPREILMNSDEISLNEIVRNNQVFLILYSLNFSFINYKM